MSKMIQFLKSNPIVTVSILVVLVSLGCLYIFVHGPSNEFRDEVTERNKKEGAVKSLMTVRVDVPGKTPDDPYQSINVSPNKANIDAIKDIHGKIGGQYGKIFANAATFNQNGVFVNSDGQKVQYGSPHLPMAANLLPRAANDGVLYEARDRYSKTVLSWLNRAARTDKAQPRLAAGAPPTAEEVEEVFQAEEDKFLSKFIPRRSREELSEKELEDLINKQRKAVVKLLTKRAKQISIYADTDIASDYFPFQIGAWVDAKELPRIADVWESQMQLWVMQDIVRAIQLANESDVGNHKGPNKSVTTAPVKRLISIQVEQGYVGLGGQASVGGISIERETKDGEATQAAGRALDYPTDAAGYMTTERQKLLDKRHADLASQNPDKRLPEDFLLAPTGRVSNVLYDVRRATVDLIVDYQKLPVLFDRIAQVNFMTVLEVAIADVDEYEEMATGLYIYGSGDAVRVKMRIESIWMRDWTVGDASSSDPTKRGFMPIPVQETLGIQKIKEEK